VATQSPIFMYIFSLLATCFITCTISGLYLFFVAQRQVNAELKHPYLKHKPFGQYPFSIRAAIFLDYFLRLMFPRTKFWIVGHANEQLAHVDPGILGRMLAGPDRHDRALDHAAAGRLIAAMQLRAFDPADFDALASWFDSQRAVSQWGGSHVRHPLTAAQFEVMLAEGRGTRPQRQCWTAWHEDRAVGHGQIAWPSTCPTSSAWN